MTDPEIELIHTLSSEAKRKWWGDGEWVEEADIVRFVYQGYQCAIRRVFLTHVSGRSFGGHLCGYIKLPKHHPYFGLEKYSDFELSVEITFFKAINDLTFLEGNNTHSFFTFEAEKYSDFELSVKIEFFKALNDITFLEETKPYGFFTEGFWIGFDFAHESDLVPSIAKEQQLQDWTGFSKPTYKNMQHAITECKKLVDELHMKKHKPLSED